MRRNANYKQALRGEVWQCPICRRRWPLGCVDPDIHLRYERQRRDELNAYRKKAPNE